jgi:hypothetical protein
VSRAGFADPKDLWQIYEQFVNVFVWNKSKLGCCSMGEHYIDT